MHRAATINFAASLAAQAARTHEILERFAEENRIARRLCPHLRTHRPEALEAPTLQRPPPEIFDTGKVRLGSGSITASFPPFAAGEQSTIFRDHRCVRCGDGEKPCVQGHPNGCSWPQARND